jgi:ferredoxin
MNRTEATQILMLSSDATFGDIKYAYRKLSLKLHPDRNKNEKDGRRFKNVLDAYHFLKGQSRLKNYNNRNKSTQKKSSYNDRQHNPEEDWSRFTKDFEMDENFWRQYETSFWKDYESRTEKKSEKNDLGKAFWDKSQENVNPKPKKKHQNNQNNVYEHNLSVDVDKSKCIGCCSCETIAPNVFAVNKITTFNPKSQVHNQYGASEGKIMDAAETCPTKAIQVNEKKSGRKIYPR